VGSIPYVLCSCFVVSALLTCAWSRSLLCLLFGGAGTRRCCPGVGEQLGVCCEIGSAPLCRIHCYAYIDAKEVTRNIFLFPPLGKTSRARTRRERYGKRSLLMYAVCKRFWREKNFSKWHVWYVSVSFASPAGILWLRANRTCRLGDTRYLCAWGGCNAHRFPSLCPD